MCSDLTQRKYGKKWPRTYLVNVEVVGVNLGFIRNSVHPVVAHHVVDGLGAVIAERGQVGKDGLGLGRTVDSEAPSYVQACMTIWSP